VEEAGTHRHGGRELPPIDERAVHEAARLFRAAGDPERLRLLALLAHGEWCVSELAEALDTGMSSVSQRLRILRSEGLVARRREGKHAYYQLLDAHVADLLDNALAHAAEPIDHPHHPRQESEGAIR
jgi:ArsR family transcriptional regulator, lead/cadmium/zinc/bismuth-responsive transcriptional repressor